MNFALDFFGLPVATRANVIIPLLIGPPGQGAGDIPGGIANSLLADMPTATFKGRVASGDGSPQDLTAAQATSLLNVATGSLKGLMSASDFTKLQGLSPGTGTGTVTTVSVVTANGVSGSVTNPTSAPAITLTLGAITPTSVAATGNVTGANLSGTNTGDQTISLTGDLTGSGTGSFAVTLATINSNTGSFGGATQVGTFTVNAKGLVTAASNVTVTPAASSITGGAALTRTNDTNVTITLGGSPGASLLAATSLTVGWSGTLAVARGGTGGGDAATARTNLGLSSIPVLMPVVAASNLAAGSTFYFGPLGPQTTNTLAPWSIAGKTGTITGFQISTTAFPGSGQTYTYTIFKNGSATAITGTITGGASNTISVTGGSVSVSGYDNFQLRLVTSAGAAATLHSGNVILSLDI